LTSYDSKPKQVPFTEKKFENRKTEPAQKIVENISVEKSAFSTIKHQDFSPL